MSGGGSESRKRSLTGWAPPTLESKLSDARFFELGLHTLEYTFA